MADFPIVGIGASAGGIEALGLFFDAMPSGSGLAFVVVQHLDPTRPSHMAEILARHTAMPVLAAEDGAPVEPERVYLARPDRDLEIAGGRLRLVDMAEPPALRHPIDRFFRALADDREVGAVGVVLAGAGSNGTAGARAIRAAGGLVLVQDPATAAFDSMPRHAIEADAANLVLAPGAMPARLLDLLRRLRAVEAPVEAPGDGRGTLAERLDPILASLKVQTGHDFRPYRRGTLVRRIARRMGLAGIGSWADYLAALRGDPAEARALANDLMIGVTGFFRDGDAWAALDEAVLAPLAARLEAGDSIRVWAVGCATGEEAYSLAMLLEERATAAGKRFDARVFATDTSEVSLGRARRGCYAGSVAAEVGEARLRRFFEPLPGDLFQVRRSVRDAVTFAPHGILRDPPFSRLDLIVCRNLLIYFEPKAQERIIGLFHFALREGGSLFLGNAETVGRSEHLFEPQARRHRIYRRIGPTRFDLADFPSGGPGAAAGSAALGGAADPERGIDAARVTTLALADRFGPAAALVDRKMRVLYLHGATDAFLTQPAGVPTRELLATVREGLRGRVAAAMQQALASGRPATATGRIGRDGREREVKVTAGPAGRGRGTEDLLLVTFEASNAPAPAADAAEEASVASLELELGRARVELRGTVEELETSIEELKASNEELVSINEELQSANEELESSKEEMQSLNEELSAVNAQLQGKVEELERAKSDLGSLLKSTEIATIFLDTSFCIRWFTPRTTELIELRPEDIGRPLQHFAPKFRDDDLLRDAAAVLADLVPIEREVTGPEARRYRRRVLPYRTEDHRIQGVVIVLDDVTAHRREGRRLLVLREIDDLSRPLQRPADVLAAIARVAVGHFEADRAFYGEVEGERLGTFHDEAAEGLPALPPRASLRELGLAAPGALRRGEAVAIDDARAQAPPVEAALEALGAGAAMAAPVVRDGRLVAVLGVHGREPRAWLPEEVELARLIAERAWQGAQRARTERAREVLLRELQHRVKNNLALVQSVAASTARRHRTPEAFEAVFRERLQALGRAQDLLNRSDRGVADLGEIVEGELGHLAEGGRARVEGEPVLLPSSAALPLSMTLHELATNAVKYGALSGGAGRVEVAWRTVEAAGHERLLFEWREVGGPSVAPPAERGFGRELIDQLIAYQLGGEAALAFEPAGVRCSIAFPLR